MRIFVLGMSGIGMHGLAYFLKKSGYDVLGWDDGKILEALENDGIIYQNKIDTNIDYVVYSSAIQPTHPLMIAAAQLNIPTINRTIFWLVHANLNKKKILVAGAHGKTTTSSAIAYMLGLKSYAVGGIILGQKHPANSTPGEYTVLETDESDGSFILWNGAYKILTNFDLEHMDFFKTAHNAKAYYKKFAMDNLDNTTLIIESEAKNILEIPNHPNIITYGKTGDYTYDKIDFLPNALQFEIKHNAKTTQVQIPLLGEHNASNFTAIFALCEQIGLPYENIASFPGIKKRMQKIITQNGYTIYSDYGHHPLEIHCTLDAFFKHKKTRPTVIIEPHRYSRIKHTWDMWPEILKNYDVFITPLHEASEKPIPGISSQDLINHLQAHGINAQFLEDFNQYQAKQDTICFSAGKLSALLDKRCS